MAYTALDQSKPTTAQTRQAAVDAIRTNQNALRDAVVALGGVPGFDYIAGTAGGGTAEQPSEMMFSRGTERVYIVLTWGTTGGSAGNVTKVAFYYSSDSGALYDPMADLAGKYVLTLTYDANSNLVSTAWGSVP